MSMGGNMGGDGYFFEESMNTNKVKSYLNSSKETEKSRGMKFLLANMSKGRDMSDFFPDVVKNVVVKSVEMKKMVYMYLVHYADATKTCRELALLSINSFQKDLAAPNQLIRASALRVMTSIRVADIIQIQLLAVRKCANDSSPYVRKCAATAIPKIYALERGRDPSTETSEQMISSATKDELISILQKLLKDSSTMVLGSAVASFNEVCPNDMHLLHSSYRKLCHLLADMDEWTQMSVLQVLTRYVRSQFVDPFAPNNGTKKKKSKNASDGSEDDLGGIFNFTSGGKENDEENEDESKSNSNEEGNGVDTISKTIKIKRRIIKKAFYSDEEDESEEEEIEVPNPDYGKQMASAAVSNINSSMKTSKSGSRNGKHPISAYQQSLDNANPNLSSNTHHLVAEEELDPDHRLVLRSSLPLLKSRNCGVVLGVCTLHYYCGIVPSFDYSSLDIESFNLGNNDYNYSDGNRNGNMSSYLNNNVGKQIGKALVRISRNRREMAAVVLQAISSMARSHPNIFLPFLSDFFIKSTDPSFCRLYKLDILLSLVNSDNVKLVLKEIQSYVKHADKNFVKAAVKAVGIVADVQPEVADKCLAGLMTLIAASKSAKVIGEAIVVIRQLLQQMECLRIEMGGDRNIEDETLEKKKKSKKSKRKEKEGERDTSIGTDFEGLHRNNDYIVKQLASLLIHPRHNIRLPATARANLVFIVSEFHHLKTIQDACPDILRLLALTFSEEVSQVKLQTLNLAVRLYLRAEKKLIQEQEETDSSTVINLDGDTSPTKSKDSKKNSKSKKNNIDFNQVLSLSRYVLNLGRYDKDFDVRDRTRFMTSILGMSSTTPNPTITRALQLLRTKAELIFVHSNKMPPYTLNTSIAQYSTCGGVGNNNVYVGEATDTYGNLASDNTISTLKDSPNFSAAELIRLLPLKDDYEISSSGVNSTNLFSISSLSWMVHHKIAGYVDLPTWQDIQPDPTVRDAAPRLADNESSNSINEEDFNKGERDASSDESEEDSSSTSDSDSDSDSDSESDNESNSDVDIVERKKYAHEEEDDSSGDDDSSDSDDSESESDDSDSDSESSRSEGREDQTDGRQMDSEDESGSDDSDSYSDSDSSEDGHGSNTGQGNNIFNLQTGGPLLSNSNDLRLGSNDKVKTQSALQPKNDLLSGLMFGDVNEEINTSNSQKASFSAMSVSSVDPFAGLDSTLENDLNNLNKDMMESLKSLDAGVLNNN